MARHARSLRILRASERQSAQTERLLLSMCGAMIGFLGIVLAACGLLSPSIGSPFYVLSGLGLIISGRLVAKRRRGAILPYVLVLAAAILWALRNMDVGGSPLAVRLAGPVLLLFIIALLMPLLHRWQPRQVIRAFALGLIGMIGIGFASTAGGPLAAPTARLTHFLDTQAKGVLQ